jgi:hypothetical protein
VMLAACGGVDAPDPDVSDPDTGGAPAPDAAAARIEITIDGLEAGWRVTTSRLTASDTPIEELQIADGSPITLSGGADDVFVVETTDADGALVETQAMYAHCSIVPAYQLDVPAEYPTIAAAMAAAIPGDTIKVAPGTYTDSVTMKPYVCLVGSGASVTTLDAGGERRTLIDMSRAPGSLVTGFHLKRTRQRTGCAQMYDPFACSGDWYTGAIYVGGEDWDDPTRDAPPIIANNVIEGNDYGVLLYWRTAAVVRNNVFVGNRFGLIATHFQSRALIANNVFFANTELAIGNHAAALDLIDNVIVGSPQAIRFEWEPTGWIRCNVFWQNGENQHENSGFIDEPRFTIGEDGNVEADPLFVGGGDFHLQPGSPAHDAGCHGPSALEPDGTLPDIGAFGGPLAAWADL